MKTVIELETERLETANRHIVATEERIEMQRRRIAKLKGNGAFYDHSEKLLASLLDTLGVMRKYRQQVVSHLVQARLQQQHSQRRASRNEDAPEE
ncbi:MAG TPA: hypothetical protein VF797_18525 [Noviherbaspirillum sp.]